MPETDERLTLAFDVVAKWAQMTSRGDRRAGLALRDPAVAAAQPVTA